MSATHNGGGGGGAVIKEKPTGVYSYAQHSIDRIVSPSTRQRAFDTLHAYASARPILFSFAAFQLLFSFLPLLLFATFALSALAFALGAAIIFAVFWIGVALLVLVPALFLASSIAVLCWSWTVGIFLVAKWLYNRAPLGVRGSSAGARQHKSAEKQNNGFKGEQY